MNILIVGLGLIGGSYAKAFKKYTDHVIAGIDRDEKTLKNALISGAIHKIGDQNDIKNADLLTRIKIILKAEPLSPTVAALKEPFTTSLIKAFLTAG